MRNEPMTSRYAAPSEPGAAAHPGTRDVLVRQLADALRRRHWRIAIRRYFMLRAYGFNIPSVHETDLRALIGTCPARDLDRIRTQVTSWCDMQAIRRRAWLAHGVPTDRFEHLHAVFRPRPLPDAD
jgi:hypothetical protein